MAQMGDLIHAAHVGQILEHTQTHTQVKLQIPRGLLSALHTWRLLISGCWLTPFNRIRLVLGFLCSVEDAHAVSPGKVGWRERCRRDKRGAEKAKRGYGCSGAGIKSGIDDTSCKTGFNFTGHFQPC